MLATITIISINVSFQKHVRKIILMSGENFTCMCTYVYLPMKDHLDDTGSSPQIYVNGENWVHYHDN